MAFNFSSTFGSLGSYGKHVYNGTLSLWGLRVTGVGTLLFALTLNPILIVAAIYGMWHVATRPRENIGASVILAVSVFKGADDPLCIIEISRLSGAKLHLADRPDYAVFGDWH